MGGPHGWSSKAIRVLRLNYPSVSVKGFPIGAAYKGFLSW